MDIEFFRESIPLYAEAAVLTLRLALLGILGSGAIGFICCLLRTFRVPVLKQAAEVYIELSRNTPLLVQLFFFISGCPASELC